MKGEAKPRQARTGKHRVQQGVSPGGCSSHGHQGSRIPNLGGYSLGVRQKSAKVVAKRQSPTRQLNQVADTVESYDRFKWIPGIAGTEMALG